MKLRLRLFLTSSFVVASLLAAPSLRAGEFKLVPDVTYLEAGRKEALDLYLPARDPAAPPAPAFVWVHGFNGDKNEQRGHEICETLAAAGYVCVNINHGPDAAFKRNILDCKNAVRFLRAHAAEYRIDPERIAIGGGSAGGYKALMVGFTTGLADYEPEAPYTGVSSAVRAVVDFYGPLGPPGMQPVDFIKPDSPPVLILHGQADRTVPGEDSLDLAAALKAKGVEHQLIILKGIGHTFRLTSTWDDKPLPQDLRPVLLEFLAKHLAPAAQPSPH